MLDKMSLKVLKSVRELESFKFEDVQKIVENLSETRVLDIIEYLLELKYIAKESLPKSKDGFTTATNKSTYRVLPSGFAYLEKGE